jgi:hypothetical protein
MWGKPEHFSRLVALRQAFARELGTDLPLRTDIRLSVRVHVGAANTKQTGDLDNFVTGICDGLQSGRGKWAQWEHVDYASVHPDKAIAIADDYAVIAIDAEKIVGDGPWYSVRISGE